MKDTGQNWSEVRIPPDQVFQAPKELHWDWDYYTHYNGAIWFVDMEFLAEDWMLDHPMSPSMVAELLAHKLRN